jgi:hypothetical protein
MLRARGDTGGGEGGLLATNPMTSNRNMNDLVNINVRSFVFITA